MKTLEEIRAERAATGTVTPSPTPNYVPTRPTAQPQVAPTDTPRGKWGSGGMLSDALDVLSTPQYAVTGAVRNLVRGKNIISGAAEGVKNRSSFSDTLNDLGVKNKYVRAVGGFIGDMALDPLTYTGLGVLKKVPGVKQVITKGEKGLKAIGAAEKLPLGLNKTRDALGSAFIYRYKQPEEYVKAAENVVRRIDRGARKGMDIGKNLMYAPQDMVIFGQKVKKGEKFSKEVQDQLAGIIRGGKTTDPVAQQLVSPVVESFKKYAKSHVKLGIAPEETFERYYGKYLPTYYRKYLKKMNGGKKMVTERLLKKGEFTDEARQAMGEITEAAYPAARGIAEESKNISLHKFYSFIDKKLASKEAVDGYIRLPNSKKLGVLADKYVPKYVHDELLGMRAFNATEGPLSFASKGLKKFNKVWKPFKTVLNPSQQVRNTVANQIQNYMVGGVKTTAALPKAIREFKTKGKFFQEAQKAGVFGRDFVTNEIDELLPGIEALKPTTVAGKAKGLVQKSGQLYNKTVEKAGNIQQTSENVAKLQQYISQRLRGKSIEEAKKAAEEALFDYSKITPFEKGLRKSVIPFYTYTRKAVPLVAKTAVNHPGRILSFKKGETALENMTPEREGERKILPPWMKGMVRVPKTPLTSDKPYFNTKYMYPWGGMLDENNQMPFGLNIPLVDMVANLGFGYSPYYNKKLTDSPLPEDMRQKKLEYAGRTLLPSVVNSVKDKIIPALTGQEDYLGRKRDIPETLIGETTGMKTYGLDSSQAAEKSENAIDAIKRRTTTEINRTLRDRSLSKDQKTKRIRRLLENQQQKMKESMSL